MFKIQKVAAEVSAKRGRQTKLALVRDELQSFIAFNAAELVSPNAVFELEDERLFVGGSESLGTLHDIRKEADAVAKVKNRANGFTSAAAKQDGPGFVLVPPGTRLIFEGRETRIYGRLRIVDRAAWTNHVQASQTDGDKIKEARPKPNKAR